MSSAIVERWVARAAAATGRRGAILCFHGVTPVEEPRGSIHLAKDEFCTLLDALAATHRFLPVSELLKRLAAGHSTRGLIAVTFDDAYGSVASLASPELEARGIPHALFAVSGAARSGEAYWWDRLQSVERALTPERWSAFEQAVRDHTGSSSLRDWVVHEHHGRWPASALPALDQIEGELGVTVTDRSVSLERLAALARNPLIEIGVHTVTHPSLPTLSDADITREVRQCYEELREVSAATLPVLAAPYGLGDERVVRISLASGMTAVLSVAGATLNPRAPAGWVPRVCLLAGMPIWKVGVTLAGWLDRRRLREPYA